jgi:nitrogen fixation protein FixH
LIEPRGIKVGKPYRYEATVLGKDGRPVEADRVVMFVYRPSDAKQDFSVALKGEGEGRYWTNLVFSAPGIWDLFLEIENSEGTQEVVRRITVS